jgi:hypothetical protein
MLVAGDAYPDFASPFGQAVVDASGAVVVIYGAASGPSCGIVCLAAARSLDGGATFTRAFAAHVVPTPTKGDYFFRIAAAGGPAGRFAAAWNDGRSDAADILVVHSDDTGATWSAPVRANDDAAGAGQDFPWLAFAPSGRLAAAWRDRRAAGAGPYTTPFEVYLARSDDGGATFSANRRLSDATSPSPAIESGNDFIGLAAASDAIHAVWGDHRTGAWSVFHGVASP